MKAIRTIGNIFVGIILFALILSLSMLCATKTFIKDDLVMGLVKTAIVESVNKESGSVDYKKDEILNEIFDDSDTDELVNIVIDNFKKYQSNKKNFSVSDSDIEKITSYAFKYKKQIAKISSKAEELSDAQLREILSKDNINNIANKIYGEISSDMNDDVDKVFDAYEKVTSIEFTLIVIGLIVFFVIILGLINWSLYKWMIVPGVCLIISGILMSLVYIAFSFFNEIVNSVDTLNKVMGNINFTIYLIIGSLEIVLGIVLIIVYSKLKNKKFNEQINNLGVGE